MRTIVAYLTLLLPTAVLAQAPAIGTPSIEAPPVVITDSPGTPPLPGRAAPMAAPSPVPLPEPAADQRSLAAPPDPGGAPGRTETGTLIDQGRAPGSARLDEAPLPTR